MALTPEEQAQLALLTAKAAEPEGGDSTTVVVQVEQPDAHAEPGGDERPPAAPVVDPAAVVLAEAEGRALVIEAETDAQIKLMDHAHELDEQREERHHERMAELVPDPSSIIDEVLGPVDAVLDVDTKPKPAHWFFRPLRGEK